MFTKRHATATALPLRSLASRFLLPWLILTSHGYDGKVNLKLVSLT